MTRPTQPHPRPLQSGPLHAWLTRWWRARTEATRHMRVVETLPLAPGRSLALVDIDGDRFLVALGKDSASTPLQLVSRPGGSQP